MADWFTDLVGDVAKELVDSPDITMKLKRAPRDTISADKLLTEAGESEARLRADFARPVRAVDDMADARQRIVREELYAEQDAITLAEERLARLEAVAKEENPGWRDKLRQRLFLSRDAEQHARAVRGAHAAVTRARAAYAAAADSDRITQLDSIKSLDQERAETVSALRGRLRASLEQTFNRRISGAIDASYAREFSYVGAPKLTDLVDAPLEQVINAEADAEVRYLITRLGSGTVGVAGPRGSGKTTLLRRLAVSVASGRGQQQWGVYVSAPAKYDTRDFLLYLFGQLCVAVLGEPVARQIEADLMKTVPAAKKLRVSATWVAVCVGTTLLACLGLVIGLRTAQLGGSPRRMADLLIASCSSIVALMAIAAPSSSPRPSYRFFMFSPVRFILRPLTMSSLAAFAVRMFVFLLSGAFAVTLFSLLGAGVAPDPGYVAVAAAGAVTVAGLYFLARLSFIKIPAALSREPEPAADFAEKWYKKVKFQQSFTTGWSGTVTLGASSLPVQLQGGKTGSAGVTPLAMSIPEIVDGFNALARKLAEINGPSPEDRVPVIIGIDEVDKIENPREAQAFFNQIKVLFGDSSCLFLISISDDAMAAFERRGLPFRDAFDSSLSTVVTLSYLPRDEARELIGSRLVDVQAPATDLLFVLSGGLPRELVRLIRRAVHVKGDGTHTYPLDELAVALTVAEVQAQQRAVLARGPSLERCAAKDALLTWAGRRHMAVGEADQYFRSLLDAAKALIGACDDDPRRGAKESAQTHADRCVARETGAFLLWLATVGQAFLTPSSRADWEQSELANRDKSFERMAEARQNFPLGPDYVLAAARAVREAWELDKEETAQEAVPAQGDGVRVVQLANQLRT